MTHIQEQKQRTVQTKSSYSLDGNTLYPQLELRISLDLDGDLQWDGFFLSIAASAVERVRVYLYEHLPFIL